MDKKNMKKIAEKAAKRRKKHLQRKRREDAEKESSKKEEKKLYEKEAPFIPQFAAEKAAENEELIQKTFGKTKKGKSKVERVKGKDLSSLVTDYSKRKYMKENRGEIVDQASEMIKSLIKSGVKHGDIHSGNIILEEKGKEPKIKLIDFENSKLMSDYVKSKDNTYSWGKEGKEKRKAAEKEKKETLKEMQDEYGKIAMNIGLSMYSDREKLKEFKKDVFKSVKEKVEKI